MAPGKERVDGGGDKSRLCVPGSSTVIFTSIEGSVVT
jgi:hypothetical protein